MNGLDPVAVVTMTVVCGFVWGGFVVLLARAIGREGAKRRHGRAEGRRGPER